GIERELLAVADGAETFRSHPKRDEIGARRERPTLAEREVVFGGAALVAVSLDRDDPGGIFLQHLGVGGERFLTVRGNLGAIELKKDRLQRRLLVDVVERAVGHRVGGRDGRLGRHRRRFNDRLRRRRRPGAGGGRAAARRRGGGPCNRRLLAA